MQHFQNIMKNSLVIKMLPSWSEFLNIGILDIYSNQLDIFKELALLTLRYLENHFYPDK